MYASLGQQRLSFRWSCSRVQIATDLIRSKHRSTDIIRTMRRARGSLVTRVVRPSTGEIFLIVM